MNIGDALIIYTDADGKLLNMDRRLNVFVNNCATDGYNFGDDSSSDEEAKRLNITYYSGLIQSYFHYFGRKCAMDH